MQNFNDLLCQIAGEERVRKEEPMSLHTTFRAGGNAAFYVMPENLQQLQEVISLCAKQKVPYYIVGNGSNLLVLDEGYQGVIISMSENWNECSVELSETGDGLIMAGAGVRLSKLAKMALDHSLTGAEFAAGIPGTVGGAVVMNAGAYGGELKDIMQYAEVMTEDGDVLCLTPEELKMGYRTSSIPSEKYIVIKAVFALKKGEKDKIQAYMDELAVQRKSKQPLEYPSAGSTFKRPTGYFAGKLIQDAGLKGFQVGGAQVSEKHSGFVINKDNATAADIVNLCDEVKRIVKEKYDVDLELEVKVLG